MYNVRLNNKIQVILDNFGPVEINMMMTTEDKKPLQHNMKYRDINYMFDYLI